MTSRPTSPFAVRGVIEGFYGRPWTHEQRLDLIRFLGAHGMNTFAYSPKDDPLLRSEWREPYSGADLERLRELVDASRAVGVDLLFCLSPGLSMRYSGDTDRAALITKYQSVRDLGVSYFGLLFDDIPSTLQFESDQTAFDDLIEAQIDLIGHVFRNLPRGARLIVCPTLYHGHGDEPGVARLGQRIDPRIELFWTGRQIVSPTLDLIDAATFTRANNRPPTYWDNYPVNDVAMTHELHVGPYRGRDRHLYRFANGVIANGMELYESSKIAFATIADYLSEPNAYDAEAAWQRAILEVSGAADAESYALFADNIRSSALADDDAPLLGAAIQRFTFVSRHGAGESAAAPPLREFADRMMAAADHLLRGPAANRALIDEGRPWIEAFEVGAHAVKLIADLAAADRLERDGPAELGPYLQRLRDARVRVFGDLLDMTLSELTAAQRMVQAP
jgi:hyaluronoglucosaminidase